MKNFIVSLFVCCLLSVSLLTLSTPQAFAKIGDLCDNISTQKSNKQYICVGEHLHGKRKYSPRQYEQNYNISNVSVDGSLTSIPGVDCGIGEICVEKEGAAGKIDEPCKDVNALLKNTPANSNAINGMVNDNTSCFLGVICPMKILTNIPAAMQDKIGKMTGLDNPDVQLALMCEEGIPSTYDPIQNKVVTGNRCICIDPAPLAASGISLLCTRYTSGIKESFLSASSILSKGTLNDGWFARILKDTFHFSALGHIINTLGDIGGALTTSQDPSKDAVQDITKKLQAEYQKLPKDSFDSIAVDVDNLNQRAAYFADCINCARRGGYYSAIGCIPMQNVGNFISGLLYRIGIGFSGAFTLLCSIYSAIRLQTSMGDAEGIANSRKILMACLSGLALVIFAVFIVRFIGVDILRVPGIS
jgi:hypothetical protein